MLGSILLLSPDEHADVINLAHSDFFFSVQRENSYRLYGVLFSCQVSFTHLIATESIPWIVYTKILKECCGEEDMSSFELFMISLSHENIFQRPLAGAFLQISNWIGPGALILWHIAIL